jgi:hypothetical protein
VANLITGCRDALSSSVAHPNIESNVRQTKQCNLIPFSAAPVDINHNSKYTLVSNGGIENGVFIVDILLARVTSLEAAVACFVDLTER